MICGRSGAAFRPRVAGFMEVVGRAAGQVVAVAVGLVGFRLVVAGGWT